MSMQGNINAGLFQIAFLTTLASISQAIKEHGFSSIDCLESKIRDIEIQIASNEDQGKETTSLKALLNNYQTVIQRYYEAKAREDKKRQKKNIIVCIIFGMAILMAFAITFLILSCENSSKNREHAYGKYVCTNCGSYETKGFSTFWYNSGILCNGDKDYCLTHADYSIFSCSHCGENFKVTRSQWESNK